MQKELLFLNWPLLVKITVTQILISQKGQGKLE